MAITDADALRVHHAIHAGDATVTLANGEMYPITAGKNGCRQAMPRGIRFMEQNRNKKEKGGGGSTTKWSDMARKGRRLTWIIVHPRWGLLVDNQIETRCPVLIADDDPVTATISATSATSNTAADPATSTTAMATSTTSSTATKRAASFGTIDEQEDVEQKRLRLDTRVFTLAVEFPKYWATPLNKSLRVQLYAIDDEYRQIKRLLQETITDAHRERFGYHTLDLVKLERVQHPDLWGHYQLRKQEVARLCGATKPPALEGICTTLLDPACNEYYFFHGLNAKYLDTITEFGFDERVSNLAGMFGCGLYFAQNSSKSGIYSHTIDCGQVGAVYQNQQNACTCQESDQFFKSERCMLVCRVVLGDPAVHLQATDKDKPLRRPPDHPARTAGGIYDSVLGESKEFNSKAALAFREFIVYDRRQCYPEYVVRFKFKKK